MIKKITKHKTILERRINHNSEQKRLLNLNNEFLSQIYSAYTQSIKNDFTQDELNLFSECEKYRNRLLQSDEVITYEIFNSDRTAIVKDICTKAASSKSWCRLLFSLVKKTNSEKIFEVGTNLGISGSYILRSIKDNPNAHFTTLEGQARFCEIAGGEFEKIIEKNKYSIYSGLYDDTFDKALSSIDNLDCAFIDGNHQYDPTLEYFNKIEPLIGDKGILLFDDINWTDGMKDAWTKIQLSPKVKYTIDLYEIGIAVIDRSNDLKKEDFAFHYDY